MNISEMMASKGRRGDNEVGHLTRGELVIPNEIIDENPKILSEFIVAMRKMGKDWRQYQVGGSDDSRNPATGMREYAWNDDGGTISGGSGNESFGPDDGRNPGDDDLSSGNTDDDNEVNDRRRAPAITESRAVQTHPVDRLGRNAVSQGAQPPSASEDIATLAEPLTGPRQAARAATPEEQNAIARIFGLNSQEPTGIARFSIPGVAYQVANAFGSTLGAGMEAIGFQGQEGLTGPRNTDVDNADFETAIRGLSPARQEAVRERRARFFRPDPMSAPSFLGLGGMSPIQQRSAIATRAVAGQDPRFRGGDAREYYDNLLRRALVHDSGDVSPLTDVLPIERQYLSQVRGLDFPDSTSALLEAIASA